MKRFIAICTHVPSTHLSPSIWICQTPSIHTIHICRGARDLPSTPRILSYTPKSEGRGRDSVSPRSDANDNCWSKCNLPDISYYKLMAILFVLIHANQNCQSNAIFQNLQIQIQGISIPCKKNACLFVFILFYIFNSTKKRLSSNFRPRVCHLIAMINSYMASITWIMPCTLL